jgi:transcriptional antiterminator RfaH
VQPARAGARPCLRRHRLERRRGLAQKLVSLAKLDRLGQLEQKVHFFAGEFHRRRARLWRVVASSGLSNPSPSCLFWAVVRAVPHHDRLAAECVAMAGFETFVPKIRVKVESRWRTTPLFAGYFFTRIVDQWRVLERTMGVLCVVKVGAVPSRCPDAEIAALLERSDPDEVIRLRARPVAAPPRRVLAPGAKVAIVDGPFRGLEGVYAGMSARERELVLLNVLGGPRPVAISAGLIVPQ